MSNIGLGLNESHLVSGFSGVLNIEKEIVIVILETYGISILEKEYQPLKILDASQNNEDNNIDFKYSYLSCHFEKLRYNDFNKDFSLKIYSLSKKYNVIIHSDDINIISKLKKNNIFGMRLKNVALSTGINPNYKRANF